MLEQLRRITPTWSTLRGTGNSRLAKMTIVMPLVGYIILFNDQMVEFLALSKNLLNIEGDIAMQRTFISLRYLYLGLASIGLGSLIYGIRCPDAIQKNESEKEYVEGEISLMSVDRFLKCKEGILKDKNNLDIKDQERIESINVPHRDHFEERFPQSGTPDGDTLNWDRWINKYRAAFNLLLSARFDQLGNL